MKIIVDKGAGVCPGVSRAIRLAEEKLAENHSLVAVGPLIHNDVEVARLEKSGLTTVAQAEFENSDNLTGKFAGKTLLVRAHGISPALRNKIKSNALEILDATCPKVLRAQQLIQKYSAEGFQIVIVGKEKHPEVIGLAGSAAGKVFVILEENAVSEIPPAPKTMIIAQTTTNKKNFHKIVQALKLRIPELRVENTICSSVSKRHQRLREFAASYDVILFVGGHHSSNTRELFMICQQANPRSYRIEASGEINFKWFEGAENIGVSGSASTPVRQLENISRFLTEHYQNGFTKINIKEVHLNG